MNPSEKCSQERLTRSRLTSRMRRAAHPSGCARCGAGSNNRPLSRDAGLGNWMSGPGVQVSGTDLDCFLRGSRRSSKVEHFDSHVSGCGIAPATPESLNRLPTLNPLCKALFFKSQNRSDKQSEKHPPLSALWRGEKTFERNSDADFIRTRNHDKYSDSASQIYTPLHTISHCKTASGIIYGVFITNTRRCEIRGRALHLCFGIRFSGFGFRVSGFGFRVSDFGIHVSGFGFRVSGFGFRPEKTLEGNSEVKWRQRTSPVCARNESISPSPCIDLSER